MVFLLLLLFFAIKDRYLSISLLLRAAVLEIIPFMKRVTENIYIFCVCFVAFKWNLFGEYICYRPFTFSIWLNWFVSLSIFTWKQLLLFIFDMTTRFNEVKFEKFHIYFCLTNRIFLFIKIDSEETKTEIRAYKAEIHIIVCFGTSTLVNWLMIINCQIKYFFCKKKGNVCQFPTHIIVKSWKCSFVYIYL